MKARTIYGLLAAMAAYVGSYFLIFDPGTTLLEGGKRIDYSVSRFAEVERIGDMSIYLRKKHWTNLVWRPVDVAVRRIHQTR